MTIKQARAWVLRAQKNYAATSKAHIKAVRELNAAYFAWREAKCGSKRRA